ncbi:MAG: DUF3035 domain-containing protein [Pseudomonadota bacterium]|nr:DUF3035 domain-containing protein [Pseudomonadota bacterium]
MKYLPTSRLFVVAVMLAPLVTNGCEGTREAMGIGKQSPDEFAVVTRAPLTMPPDYGLRPPRPGAKRPQEKTVTETARERLVGSRGSTKIRRNGTSPSTLEAALLSKAGAKNPDPEIRRIINRESSILAMEDHSFADRLIFWQQRLPRAASIDAAAENKRLRENAALGDPPTKGRSPRIIRKRKGWLEGVFK